jgi:hypothetical protein
MPSQTKSWVTTHEELSLLHIGSSDPRRKGRIDLAYFDTTIADRIAQYQWCIRRGVPFNTALRTTLSAYCAHLYQRGSFRYEPDCNYTSGNFYNSTISKQDFLDKVASLPKVRMQDRFFDRVKYKKRSDTVQLEVRVQCRRTLTITVNACYAHLIPRKMFLSHKKLELCIWPTKNNPTKKTLAYYLLNKINKYVPFSAYKRVEGSSLLDYTIRDDESGYVNSVSSYTKYHRTPLGTVIEVGGVKGAYKTLWAETSVAYRYPQGTLMPGDARVAYVLVPNDIVDKMMAEGYVTYNNYDFVLFLDNYKETLLTRYVAINSGMKIENIFIPSRNTKGYEKAIERGDLRRRARYENKIISEQATNGRMFTEPRFIKRRNVYADTTTEVTLSDGRTIFALDCRPEHLVVGSKGRARQQESKPLSANELKILLESTRIQPTQRDDI